MAIRHYFINKFRKDLFFRLNTFAIRIPPLNEHLSDLPLLCQHFINNYNHENGTTTDVSGQPFLEGVSESVAYQTP
jgi:DNA-binding NtrC family response regulator